MKLEEVTQRKLRVKCEIEYDSNVGKHDEVINVVFSISGDSLGHPSLSVVEIGGSEGIVAPEPIQFSLLRTNFMVHFLLLNISPVSVVYNSDYYIKKPLLIWKG